MTRCGRSQPRAVLALLVMALLGCDQIGTDRKARDAAEASRFDIQLLQQRIEALEERERGRELTSQESTTLVPSDHGFGTVRSTMGILTFALKDVDAFADGSRIRIQVGNPLAAGLSGVRAMIIYGSANSEGSPTGRAHRIVYPFEGRLEPGTRRSFNIDLPGVPPTRLGYVTVTVVSVSNISLFGDAQ